MSKAASEGIAAIHWFRKGLRLHDNPALLEACKRATVLYPIFIIDPHFAKPDTVGINRYQFLLESLQDLDQSLKTLGSRLFVVRGKPEEELPALCAEWGVSLLTFESDTEPYAIKRDKAIVDKFSGSGGNVFTFSSHTLRDTDAYLSKCGGKVPGSYQGFCKLFQSLGKIRDTFDMVGIDKMPGFDDAAITGRRFDIPTLSEMGYSPSPASKFRGGETEALRRLEETVIARPGWVAAFEKPLTSPNSLDPSTTVLSPYIKFGCLSPVLFYLKLEEIYKKQKHSLPPVSLHGQMLFREYFYLCSVATPNFHLMKGNPRCKQIPWGNDPALLESWKKGRTGYPFIDAIMTQLREEGWIHHLARHAVACFLTRGDLWQSWEAGARVFDLYLLDSDYALNNANWQWLSCSNFFFQYFRVYSPVAFGKKTDPNGDYIRKWLPQLAAYPAKFIYEPWKAPIASQRQYGCVVGVDYPERIVVHEEVVAVNMQKMKLAYASQEDTDTADTNEGNVGDSGAPLGSAGGGSSSRGSKGGGEKGSSSSSSKIGGRTATASGDKKVVPKSSALERSSGQSQTPGKPEGSKKRGAATAGGETGKGGSKAVGAMDKYVQKKAKK